MSDIKKEQEEALVTVYEYIEKLFAAIPKVCGELRAGGLPDTQEYLKAILNGVNFVTEVFNRTMDYVNADKQRLDKEVLNGYVIKFMEDYKQSLPAVTADALENYILTYLMEFYDAIGEVCPEVKDGTEGE